MAVNAKWYHHLIDWIYPNLNISNGVLVDAHGVPLSPAEVKKFQHTGLLPIMLASEYVPEDTYNDIITALDATGDPFWNSLTEPEKTSFIRSYGTAADIDTMRNDLNDLASLAPPPDLDVPVASDYIDSPEVLYGAIDDELSGDYRTANTRLNLEADNALQSFQDQLRESTDDYNRRASGILSNQYMANAQVYDTLQSDLRKSRQNALEAGASAGLRIAGNVNALLSAQNKQAQTSMDTSNALAEMLLQQRNAAAGLRSDYRNYMSDVNQRRTDLDTQRRTERENLYNQRHNAQTDAYNTAMSSYNTQWDTWNQNVDAQPASNKFTSAYGAYMRNQRNSQ